MPEVGVEVARAFLLVGWILSIYGVSLRLSGRLALLKNAQESPYAA